MCIAGAAETELDAELEGGPGGAEGGADGGDGADDEDDEDGVDVIINQEDFAAHKITHPGGTMPVRTLLPPG